MKRYGCLFIILLTAMSYAVSDEYATLFIVRGNVLLYKNSKHNININDTDVADIFADSYLKVLIPAGAVVLKDLYTYDIYIQDDKGKMKYDRTEDRTAVLQLKLKAKEEYYVHIKEALMGAKLQLVEKPKDLQKVMKVIDNGCCLATYNLSEQQPEMLASNKPTKVTQTVQDDKIVSGVDKNIPIAKTTNDKTFAVIIANENYQEVSKVPFAIHDGEMVAEYCKKTLGIPADNIRFVQDATYNNIRQQVNWLKNVITAYNGEAKVIFYYAGHGVPDEANKTAFLLPVDGSGSDSSTGYSLNALYQTLGELPSPAVTVLLDACFSGAKREGGMLASARGVAIKVKSGQPVGNTVVFSAATGDETAYPNKEEGHGMFTYYLLKKLQDTAGNVTYGELGDYIRQNVSRQSVVLNNKSQTPTVIPSASLGTNWQQWKLK